MSVAEDRRPPPRSTISRQIRQLRARDAALRGEAGPGAGKKTAWKEGPALPPVARAQAEREWDAWFASRGWRPFDYQREAWRAFAAGQSGLIVLPTGSGKTFAALGGPLLAMRAEGTSRRADEVRVLYITPLKALVRDLEKAVQGALDELGWSFRVETRTGDTTAAQKKRQRERLPHILFTTPESLALILTQPDWQSRLGGLEAIILDEWHELLGSKRGSLLELTLARLRAAAPRAKTWAVSATIADEAEAAQVATGVGAADVPSGLAVVRADAGRVVEIETLLPLSPGDLPWFGHSGLRRVPEVAAALDPAITTMIFTNTRGQAERWFASLLAYRPEWEGKIALHHGSLDREERERVETAVKDGTIPFVVATTSLDLGVDFPHVQKVIQIGSVKGVSRATQRAGRAFHRPGEQTCLTVCPTHFMEYIEVAALRRALAAREIDPRSPRERPLDVLVQFVLSCGLGEGFRKEELLREIRTAYSFRDVSDDEFNWVMNFVTTGGHTLRAYPQFQKLVLQEDGRYRFATPRLARFHLLNIGTIVAESGVRVRFLRGSTLGQIDEGFVTKLRPGDIFRFAGKTLALVQIRDLNAYVKLAKGKETAATVWGGHALPISPPLSAHMREILGELAVGAKRSAPSASPRARPAPGYLPPELAILESTLAAQRKKSAIPARDETLVERIDTREGHHLFVYTWEGRAVNEGLGHLLAYRLARLQPNTIAVSANDHGFECLGTRPFPGDEEIRAGLLPGASLAEEIEQSLNFPEMAKRAFREIARIAGLIQVGAPGERKSTRHLQMSSSLLFDVFRNYDPTHPLLLEAFREVKRAQLELPRLAALLARIAGGSVRVENPSGLTPFAFPLYIDRIRSRLSTESLADRIERMQRKVFAP